METKYCPNCMRVLESGAGHRLCPNCGFDPAAHPQPQNALQWGDLLRDRYIVGRVLGQGGFGITYVGFDRNLQCKVAIKEYYPQGVAIRDASQSHCLTWPASGNARDKEAGCESFLREARKMARIGSIPGIVRVIDTFTENDTSYIIMDYLEGVTLRQYIATNGPLSLERCLDMLRPLCASIDRMHQKNMIHRDISPDNIMVRGDGTLWLLDFGAAKDIEVSAGTESSAVVAKKGFSPLEQYSGRNIGPWTDVYAMCATMYFCVSGRTLPDASERVEDDSIQWGPAEVPDNIRNTFQHGLSIRYSDRVQSISELINQLDGDENREDRKEDTQKEKEREKERDPSDSTGVRKTDHGTVLVDKADRDRAYDISFDPVAEEASRQKRKDLMKRVPIIAAAVLLLAGISAFAVSRIGSGSSGDGDPAGSGVSDSSGGAGSDASDGAGSDVTAETVEDRYYVFEGGGSGSYTGEWQDGKPNGSGTMTIVEEVPLSGGQSLPAGAVYTCDNWEDGYPDVHGTAEFPDGARYEGDWAQGILSGQGVMTYADGGVYDGEWANGTRNGQGKMTYAGGNTYEGGWKDDLRDGHGTVVRITGETFEGEWVQGEQVEPAAPNTQEGSTGQQQTAQNTTPSTGQQKPAQNTTPSTGQQPAQNTTPSTGQQTAQNTTPSSGQQQTAQNTTPSTGQQQPAQSSTSSSGQQSAPAPQEETYVTDRTFTNSNGVTYTYTGEVSGGKPNGTGTSVYESGSTYTGGWKDGQLHGQGTYTWASGEQYVGEYKNGARSGTGTYTWPSGAKYEGEYKNGKRDGTGTYTWASGRKYVGQWKDGEEDGQGVLYNADGTVDKSGIWENGEFVSD